MDIIERFTLIMNNNLKRRAIGRIRKDMYLLNCPIEVYTDEQIEEGLIHMAKILARTGHTMEDFLTAAKNYAKLGV